MVPSAVPATLSADRADLKGFQVFTSLSELTKYLQAEWFKAVCGSGITALVAGLGLKHMVDDGSHS